MKNFFLIIGFIFPALSCPGYASAGGSTHHAYKITSYNLAPVLNNIDSSIFNSSTEFKPLLITNTKTDILNNELEGTVPLTETSLRSSNTNSIALSAQFDATQKISLHGAFSVTRNLWTPESFRFDNKSSWEANLGIIYKLLDNISYEMHFGYMDTGDLFTERNVYSDVESIIMVSNQLTLSF